MISGLKNLFNNQHKSNFLFLSFVNVVFCIKFILTCFFEYVINNCKNKLLFSSINNTEHVKYIPMAKKLDKIQCASITKSSKRPVSEIYVFSHYIRKMTP